MRCFKKFFAVMLALAMVIALLPTTKASAAAKISSKKETIYVGEKLKLYLTGTTGVKWTTSNKSVATVSSEGVVKGIKAGNATITATDTVTKKAYKCKVTVNKLKSFGYGKDDIRLLGDLSGLYVSGSLVNGSTFFVDGKELTTVWKPGNGCFLNYFDEPIDYGYHTVKVSKRGYLDYSFETLLEEKTFENDIWYNDPYIRDNTLYLLLNPDLYEKVNVLVDGKEITPDNYFVNSDPIFVIWIDASSFSAGEHTVELKGDGIKNAKKSFTK